MKSGDVTDTLDLALQASGGDQATVLHKPRLLSDNGSSYGVPHLNWPTVMFKKRRTENGEQATQA